MAFAHIQSQLFLRCTKRFRLIAIISKNFSYATHLSIFLTSCPFSSSFFTQRSPLIILRTFATQPQKKSSELTDGSYLERILSIPSSKTPSTTTEKVAEKATNVALYGMVAVGVLCLFGLGYLFFDELFSSTSPNRIYGKSVKLIRKDERCVSLFGWPIKAYGEETGRGRRRHVRNVVYEKEGKKRVRVLFYVKGPVAQGVAQAEIEQNEAGRYDYRYLFVETNEYPPKTVLVIDNRH